MEQTRDLRLYLTGAFLAAYAAATALAQAAMRWILAAAVLAIPILTWILASPVAWTTLFFVVAVMSPPLPVQFGNSGPHPALAIATIGAAVGFIRLSDWRFERNLVPGILVVFF